MSKMILLEKRFTFFTYQCNVWYNKKETSEDRVDKEKWSVK
ncbi:hypothetical protein [Salipaludibacillus agaradhaerens]|nr:hypothetical protein [Salipaludibacillus agaradhaerens]